MVARVARIGVKICEGILLHAITLYASSALSVAISGVIDGAIGVTSGKYTVHE